MAENCRMEFSIPGCVCEMKQFNIEMLITNHLLIDSSNSVPFNTEIYSGFYIELTLQMFTVHFYMLIFSSIISIFNVFHTFIDSLIVDYSTALDDFNELLNGGALKSADIKLESECLLKDSIELHIGIVK